MPSDNGSSNTGTNMQDPTRKKDEQPPSTCASNANSPTQISSIIRTQPLHNNTPEPPILWELLYKRGLFGSSRMVCAHTPQSKKYLIWGLNYFRLHTLLPMMMLGFWFRGPVVWPQTHPPQMYLPWDLPLPSRARSVVVPPEGWVRGLWSLVAWCRLTISDWWYWQVSWQVSWG